MGAGPTGEGRRSGRGQQTSPRPASESGIAQDVAVGDVAHVLPGDARNIVAHEVNAAVAQQGVDTDADGAAVAAAGRLVVVQPVGAAPGALQPLARVVYDRVVGVAQQLYGEVD